MAKKGFKLPRVTGKFQLSHMQKLGLVFVAAAVFVYILKTQTSLLEGMEDASSTKPEEKKDEKHTAPAPAKAMPPAKAATATKAEGFKGRRT